MATVVETRELNRNKNFTGIQGGVCSSVKWFHAHLKYTYNNIKMGKLRHWNNELLLWFFSGH